MKKIRENIIRSYIEGYNEFDVQKMIRDLDDNIVFQNIQNEEITLELSGIDNFIKQAEEVKNYFKYRHQEVISIKHIDDKTTIAIDFTAVAARNLPNGMKKGQKLKLTGESIFSFQNNKVIKIMDIS